jgi:hypothetical protein
LVCTRVGRENASAEYPAVNPDAPDSAMAIMKQTLTTLLHEHSRSQTDALKLQQERQERFEKEVRDALVRLESKRTYDQKTPRSGFDFEDAVAEFVTSAVRNAPCLVEVTGKTAGLRTRCKKGDLVLRFAQESVFEGAGVVFEAKRDASYTPQKALEELDTARANRNAGAGVFVMARSHAPDGFPTFARFGSNVLVVWDDSNAAADPYLHAAILLGLGLATRAVPVPNFVSPPSGNPTNNSRAARVRGMSQCYRLFLKLRYSYFGNRAHTARRSESRNFGWTVRPNYQEAFRCIEQSALFSQLH